MEQANPPAVARTGFLVLTAVATQVVIVVALANQWVSDNLVSSVRDSDAGERLAADSWLTYSWRVSAKAHESAAWRGQLTLLVVTVVITALLVLAIGRGAVTFARAFFGTWTAVVAATLIGAFGRGLVDPGPVPAGAARVTRALFGENGPDARVALGAAALGLATALLTALIAVATRREPAVPSAPAAPPYPQYVPPEQPPPYYGERAPWQDERTTQLPRQGERSPDQPTQRFPWQDEER